MKMSKASVANFRQRLALAWKEHNGSVPVTGKKRGRDDCRTTKDVSSHEHKVSESSESEVVPNRLVCLVNYRSA